MNAARDSDSPRYPIRLLTRRHRGATTCQSLIILRETTDIRIRNSLVWVKIVSILLIIDDSTSENYFF